MNFNKILRSYNFSLVNLILPHYIHNNNMPRKSKKAKFKPHKVPVNQYGEIFSNSGAVNDISPIATLKYFYEMFSDRIDKDVIKLVLDECDFNVDQASETLMSLCNDENREQPEYDERNAELNVLDYGVPYYNNAVYSENVDTYNNFPYDAQSSFANNTSENPNDRPTTSAQGQTYSDYNYQNFINYSWNSYVAPDETSSENPSSTANSFIPEAWNDSSTNKAIVSSSNLNPNAPSFIVPMLPIFSPSPHKSPVSEISKGTQNVSNARHFSSSASKSPCKKKANPAINDVVEKIKCGNRILVILRGLPGSGKSTLALKLKFSGIIFSTDDFFMKKGKYVFDQNRLSQAHEWNRLRTKLALQKGITPIIIDNTNTEAWEMKPYVLMGKKYNYEVVILEPDTPWKFNVKSLALRNKHGVHKSKIALMKERYEHGITVEKILATANLPSTEESVKIENDKPEIINDENYVVEGNHISLKAIVHTEDNSPEENSQISTDSDLQLSDDKGSISNSDHKIENEDVQYNAFDWDNSHTCQTDTFCDLDELRALAKNDSEDSQSCYSSTNTSSCEVSGWEAITEPDNDFFWSASSNDVNSISKSSRKSRSADNLYIKESGETSSAENVINFSQNSSENIFGHTENKSIAAKFESNSEPLLTCSSLHKKEKIVNCSNANMLSMHSSNFEYIDQCVDSIESNLQSVENVSDSFVPNNNCKIEKHWSSFEENDTKLNQLSSAELCDNDKSSFKSSTESLIIHDDVPYAGNLINHLNAEEINNNDNDSFKSSNESLIIHDVPCTEISVNWLNTNETNNNDNISFKSSIESLIIHEDTPNAQNNNQQSDFVPKPQRNNLMEFVTFNKAHFSELIRNNSENEGNSDPLDLDWSSVDSTKDENLKSQFEVSDKEKIISTPKPPRRLSNSLSIDGYKHSDEDNSSNKTKSLLNISAESIGQIWTFPELTVNSPPYPVNSEKKPLTFKMSMYCQTEPRDFDYLYKISSGNNNINLIGYTILNAKLYNQKRDDFALNEDPVAYHFADIATFDKSTSTDDMVDDIEVSQKLAHLQSCFPDISKEDLLHLLEICYNDERWISNLLLDWGYKYNVPVENSSEKNDEETICGKKYNVNSDVYDDAVNFSLWKENALSKSSTTSSLDTDTTSKNSSEETKEWESTEEEAEKKNVKLQLVLDPAFVCQLKELFGPLPNSGNRKIHVDYEFAKVIYEKLSTVSSIEDSVKDEESHLSHNSKPKRKKEKKNKKSNKPPQSDLTLTKNGDSSFSEIMDMEYARQLHIERMKKDDDFRTKMMRSELYRMFPGADTIVLDEIFESNNYSLENSLQVLGAEFTQQETIEKKRNVEKFDAQIKEWEKTKIFQEFETGDWSDWIYQDDTTSFSQEIPVQVQCTTISDEAAALREEAAEHYQLRQEFIQKAQSAYCRGMKDVASFYAQKGTEEGKIAKDTNKLAAALIAQERNSSNPVFKIDLHGLHVQEAIPLLERFLFDKKLEIRRRLHPIPVVVTIITGQGHHSAQGAKLRPAVVNYLKSFKYSFSEIKVGQIEVTLVSG